MAVEFRLILGQGGRRVVEIEQLVELHFATPGEFEQGFHFRIRFPARLYVLVVFGVQISELRKLLLREATGQSDLFYARYQALRRFVCHNRP